jgi:class 3 adenylate cyclase
MSGNNFRLSKFTLGVKLSIFVVAIVMLVSASMAYFLVYRSAADRRASMENRFSSLARIIGGMRGHGYGGRQYDPMLVKMFVDFGVKMGTNLCFTVFSNADDVVEEGNINQKLLEEAVPDFQESIEKLDLSDKLTRIKDRDWRHDSIRPYKVKLAGKEGEALGWALLGFSTKEMERQIQQSVMANLMVTGIAFLCGLIGALFLARRFSRPIRQVAQAMQGVSEGKLDQTLTVYSKDEIGVLAQSFNFMAKGLRERERIRSTFARYVSDQVAERILKEEDELDLAGELKRVTVLFLDIRGFTSLSEHLHPREVVALLNDYFEIIIEVIFRNEGTINKFIGDSIMAIYGAPKNIEFPEMRAVNTAVDIQSAIGKFNWTRMQEGKPVVNFGIGIHSGEAIAGNIGSALRMEYTVIGRDVNLAQRIESSTHEGQILISESTYKKVAQIVDVNPKDPVVMKGIVEPIPLYEVIGLKTGASQS